MLGLLMVEGKYLYEVRENSYLTLGDLSPFPEPSVRQAGEEGDRSKSPRAEPRSSLNRTTIPV
jgi:hypothetical protein